MDKLELISEIERLKKEKNAIVMAHYYTTGDVQDVADYIGDSLALAREAARTSADVIIFAGVSFMGETAKVLSPQKRVFLPDTEAGCSLADSCKAEDFEAFIAKHPGHTVISYVNTSVGVKALTDIVCTSSNAVEVVSSLPQDEKIIFGPDRNLGGYIANLTGRDMVLWDGACHVHEKFSLERIMELKESHPDAKILAHPECKRPIVIAADKVGSTAALLDYAIHSDAKEFIVATEPGIIHQMSKAAPDKLFIAAPPTDSTCGCNDCSYMKLVSLEKIYASLKDECGEVFVGEDIRVKAEKSILRMLELS